MPIFTVIDTHEVGGLGFAHAVQANSHAEAFRKIVGKDPEIKTRSRRDSNPPHVKEMTCEGLGGGLTIIEHI